MGVTCPFCGADEAKLISLFGSQLLLSQYRCPACGSYFEGLRQELPLPVGERPSEGTADAS